MHSFYEQPRSAYSFSAATYPQWAPFSQHCIAGMSLEDWPRLSLTQRNLMWCSADKSYFYISYPPPFVQSSAACCLWLAAQIALGAAVGLAEPDREAEVSLKLLVSSLLSCAKFTSLTLGTDEKEACHD